MATFYINNAVWCIENVLPMVLQYTYFGFAGYGTIKIFVLI